MTKKYKFSEEQNGIIRSPIDQPIIVDGVVGSGKTLIALERIKYLMNKEDLNYNNIIFLTSTNFLLDYISEAFSEMNIKEQCDMLIRIAP